MARRRTPGPTERELAILGVLWDRGPSTVREVHEALHPDARTGYTTTLKLMQIMVEKGLLARGDDAPSGVEGGTPSSRGQDARDMNRRGHIYRPALSEEKTQKQLVRDLLEKVFAGSAEKLVMRALAAKKVSPRELKRIRAMLDEIEGE